MKPRILKVNKREKFTPRKNTRVMVSISVGDELITVYPKSYADLSNIINNISGEK